ncbi:hypothetical protein OQA88_7558 [Cercophora sp. LCS_1]
MFRDESSHVIKKAKAKAKRKGHLIIEPNSSPDLRNRHSLTPEPRAKALSLVVPRSTPQTPRSPGQQSVWSHDDNDSIMSPESGSWPVTPAMALLYNLAPTCQERGTAYFFSRFVTMEETASHQKFDFLYQVWKPVQDREVDGVLASMTAVGLMGLATMTRSPEMMEAAQKSYGSALRLINHALENPSEAAKDTTMLSVLILGVFEMMTEDLPRTRTIEAFQEHVNGAAALAIMRGTAQFGTSAGKRMFAMLCQRVVISCIQKAMPVPQPLVELFREMTRSSLPNDPAVWTTAFMFEVLQIRYDIKRGAVTDPELIIQTLIEVEERYETFLNQVPQRWQYRTFKLSRPHPAVYNGFCHVYHSMWHLTVWNALRTSRILVLETILSQIYEYQSYNASDRYVEDFNKAKQKLRRLVHDIVASVPQHLGLVNPADGSIESSSPASPPITSVEVRETPSPPTSPSTRSDSVSSGGYPSEFRGQPSGLTILDVMRARDAEDEAHRFMLLVSATSNVIWPLYIVGMSSVCTNEVKSYTIDRLRTLYMETGIRQADSIANLLEEHETSWEWLEAPMQPLPPMIKFEDFEDYTLQFDDLHQLRDRHELDIMLPVMV